MAYEEKNSQTTIHQTHQRNNRISSFSVILIAVCLSLLGVLLIPKLSVKLNPSRRSPFLFPCTVSRHGWWRWK